jgi:TfoX/Sxy family transcriptional regulator of competence genes
MTRDAGLEELIQDELKSTTGVTEKAMFGGWAWLFGGNLFCGARQDGMLVRLGKEQDAWALEISGVVPMLSRGRRMHGWVRADAQAYGNDITRHKLIASALHFVQSLPTK